MIHCLLIEDNVADAKLFKSVLHKIRDFEAVCEVASDLESAMEILKTESIEMVFTDYCLGGQSGLEIYEQIRAGGYENPVIMITGDGSDKVAVDAMKAGLDDFLCKDALNQSSLHRSILIAQAKHALRKQIAEQQRQIIVAERNRVMSQSLGATCHHISQPLTVMMANIDLLMAEEEMPREKRDELLQQTMEGALRMREILQAMRYVDDYRTVKYVESLEILDLGLDKTGKRAHGT